MKRSDWRGIERCVRELAQHMASGRFDFDDADIVLTYLWACYHDKPIRWACQRFNWPVYHRRPIPSESTMSRRMRAARVSALLDATRRELEQGPEPGFVRAIDGKILTVAAHSIDPDATFGGPRGRRRGYELHSVCTLDGRRNAWSVHTLGVDERVAAIDLIPRVTGAAYILGDTNYHSNNLCQIAAAHEMQWVAQRRRRGNGGLGHHPISNARRRCLDMVEFAVTPFTAELYETRRSIETMHANLVSCAGGLNGLPPWIRRIWRVRNWIAAKLVLDAARRDRLRRARHAESQRA